MEILIDTNVVLDWLFEREPFLGNAKKILEPCLCGKIKGHLSAHTLLNVFYIARKWKSVAERKEILLLLCEKFNIISIDRQMIISSLKNDVWNDLEGGLQMQYAATENLDAIITRDKNDFKSSPIKIYSPGAFLELFQEVTLP